MGSKGGGQQIAVVDYAMSMHYGVAISADSLTGIYAQQKTVWEGSVDVDCVININNPSLFGGPKAQGGMVGQAHVLFGGPDQIAPDALATRLGLTNGTCPAFRSLLTVFFCSDAGGGFHFQYNSPNMPPLSFKLQRTPRAPALDPTYALIAARGAAADRLVSAGFNDNLVDPDTGLPITITGTGPTYGPTIPDANPAYIIYELLTNSDWGMGLDPSGIETATFQAAGITLFNEKLGLSIVWTSQETIDALVTQILGTIQGALYTRPSTGKFELKLFRPDYWLTAPTGIVFRGAGDLNQNNCVITSFSRKIPGELANEVVVDWTNPLTEQTESITIQDPGSIANQNAIVSQRSTYPGVRNELLAVELGQRDLASVGAALGVIEAQVNRTLWNLVPGDVVTVHYTEYGLAGLICRIVKIDYGKPGDAAMKVNLIEDFFAAGSNSYLVQQPPVWEDPKKDPAPVTLVQPLTLPRYMLLNLSDGGVAAGREFADVTVGMIAAPPIPNAAAFELVGEIIDSLGNETDTDLGTKTFMAHGVSSAALPRAASSASFVIGAIVGNPAIPVGTFLVMVSDSALPDRSMEIMAVAAYDTVLKTAVLERGLFDTIPQGWPSGTPFFLVNQVGRIDDPIARAAGGTFDYKLLTIAGAGRLAPALAPTVEFKPTQRPFLPNRPAKITVAGSAFDPVNWTTDDDIPLTWANRNRDLEETRIVLWNDADIPPEDGQTTTVVVWDNDLSFPSATIDGLTGTSYDLPVSSFGANTSGYVQFLAKRDGLESQQGLMIHVGLGTTDVSGTGYGYDYGNNYGGDAVIGGGGADDWIVIHNDHTVTIDGLTWQALNADTAHSALYSPSLDEYKFEVLNGEHYAVGVAWDDPPETMRSELYGPPFAFDAVSTFKYELTVMPGQEPTTNQWFIVGQIHVGAFVGTGGSPPVALDVRPDGSGGEKLQLDYNYQPIGTSTITYATLGSMPGFTRGTPYDIELVYKDDHGGPNGYVKLTVNGVVIVEFTGVTGYSSSTSGSYPKLGIYTGGNGTTLDLPLPGQDIVATYKNITFRVASVVVDAFYISPSIGSDTTGSGTRAQPFATPNKGASSVTTTRRTVYLMAGTHNVSAWTFPHDVHWEADPAAAPGTVIVNTTTPNLGATATANITVKNLKITTSLATGGSILEFVDCDGLQLLGNNGVWSTWMRSLFLVYRPGPGFCLQGNSFDAPTMGPTNADGVFPYNIITNDSANYNNWKITDNEGNGSTFPIQAQQQGLGGVHSDIHCERNKFRNYGNVATTATIGNIGISWVLSTNPANHDNTCCDNDLQPAAGVSALGVEAGMAGCTYRDKIVAAYGYAIGDARNSLFDGADLTTTAMAYSNDGEGYTAATAATVEIRDNMQNGALVSGAGTPTNLVPLPSATGLPTNTTVAPYVP